VVELKACVRHTEGSVYIGSRRGYDGPSLTESDVQNEVGEFQTEFERRHAYSLVVRVTRVTYQFKDYLESGWELTAINYPRFREYEPGEVKEFVYALACRLLERLGQNRVGFTTPDGEFWLVEAEDARERHDSPINVGPVS
jgi:hypothetical protein